MCGRFGNALSPAELASLLTLSEESLGAVAPGLARPRYNISPLQDVLVVRPAPRSEAPGGRVLASLRWGLVPFWARDPKIASRLINARAETLADKRAFQWAYRQRRCLVPADGFYEWRKAGTQRLPYHFGLPDGAGFCMAGLWERWQPRDAPQAQPGAGLETFTLVTTEANDLVRPVHDRMPVILRPEDFARWLDPRVQDPAVLQELLRPFPSEAMVAWRVSKYVSDYRNEGPQCREPVGQLALL